MNEAIRLSKDAISLPKEIQGDFPCLDLLNFRFAEHGRVLF